ncbi:S41 family peptidase [Heliophilum fasciatum]|uniref:S41A family C-terminal processing peptidase-3 n=1 Tax=Heliophilum fasciatum TaxID=35700 RepID=A0A4R2RFF9_9FIRM|nr:S41 family peptidase [Heliophilum fasciatum]MCW2279220.1 carboxyl-terminal processing protease [Heliophilum fasciatum]TCP60807.1 S41A family C-terminal processing peptidase-3 [Heliophilum fasciatum]
MAKRKGLIAVAAVVAIVSTVVTGTLVGLVVANYQHLGRLARVVRLVTTEYLEPVTMSGLVDGAMKGMVASLKDPYSSYMSPEEYKHLYEQIQGSFTGIGVYISKKDMNKTVIVSPIKGGPADRAGLKAGDVISKVNGEDVTSMDVDIVVSKIKGPEGTEVALTVFREAEKRFMDLTLTREVVNIPVVTAELAKQNEQIGVIKIAQFNQTAAAEVDKAVQAFMDKKVRGFILDLRDNPGGELDAAVDIASYFVPEGPVVYVVDNRGVEEIYNTTHTQIDLPVVVLVNEGSASASEIVAGAIKDSGTGSLVGNKTFGKGIVQSVIQLDAGSAVKLTTAKYLTPKKNDIHKIGIEPDVKVELPKDANGLALEAKEGEPDQVMEKGIEVLKTMMPQ